MTILGHFCINKVHVVEILQEPKQNPKLIQKLFLCKRTPFYKNVLYYWVCIGETLRVSLFSLMLRKY